MILYLFIFAFGIRLISLFISIRNEKRLKMDGAMEYGKANSLLLTLSHVAFYGLCLYEGLHNNATIINVTYIGIALFAFSMAMLFLVIKQLGPIWTVKLIIAKGHKVNKSMIFKYIRHPNYFLNVIPELVAIAMICQAWTVLMIGLPIYLIPLAIRIYQEEKIMKEMVKDY
ncbi:MAG TPA: isoprenylcysteine carboxylmethyltransferase family protein [Cyclobacteriaceae bacterium]